MKYSVDFYRLVLQLLPTFLRQPLIFGLLRAAVIGLLAVYKAFIAHRNGNIYRLTHNGQVCYLRAVLNDAYKSRYGRFDILTIERNGDWLYAITETGTQIRLASSENQLNDAGKYVDDNAKVPVLANELMLNAEQNNFIVSVPADLYQTSLADIAALVDKYKLISKRAIYMQQS